MQLWECESSRLVEAEMTLIVTQGLSTAGCYARCQALLAGCLLPLTVHMCTPLYHSIARSIPGHLLDCICQCRCRCTILLGGYCLPQELQLMNIGLITVVGFKRFQICDPTPAQNVGIQLRLGYCSISAYCDLTSLMQKASEVNSVLRVKWMSFSAISHCRHRAPS